LVHFFSLREDEPLVDFAFLWVIMSVFVGIVDTIGIVEIPVRIQQTLWASIVQVWLLFGLIWSLVSLWVVAKKSSKKAKILNIVEEPTSHKHIEISNQPKRPVQHLFDELDE
jgi:hypothetical protein